MEEFKLFHQAVSIGGPWCSASGLPNFDRMACWWSSQANGNTIFYKLREHLATYYKTWTEHQQEKQTMVASQSIRQANERRVRSTAYVSKVLPPALPDRPGQSIGNQGTTAISETFEHHGIQSEVDLNLEAPMEIDAPEFVQGSSSSMQTANLVQNSSINTSQTQISLASQQNVNLPSETIIPQSEPTFDGFVMYQPLQPGQKKPKRRCAVCLSLGKNGYNCPGAANRSRCTFAEVNS